MSSSYSLIAAIPEPKFYYEVVKDPKWQDVTTAKINALESNNTWTLTPLPPHKRAIGCKWVYKVKYKADGLWKGTKHSWLQKGLLNKRGWTLLKLSLLLLR